MIVVRCNGCEKELQQQQVAGLNVTAQFEAVVMRIGNIETLGHACSPACRPLAARNVTDVALAAVGTRT